MTVEGLSKAIAYYKDATNGFASWDNVRSTAKQKAQRKEINVLGRNKTIFVLEEDSNRIDLQVSRGISFENIEIPKIIENIREPNVTALQNERVQMFREHVPEGKRVLEIGFRACEVLYILNDVYEAVGVECSSVAVEVAKLSGYDVHLWDIQKAPPGDLGLFDAIACYHVLEHTSAPLESLKAIVSLLKPNGILHCEVPIEGSGPPNLKAGHLYPFEANEMEDFMKHCNLEIISHSNKPYGEHTIARKK